MRRIISMLLQNEVGALARVANLFSARGYNIDSLTVAATHEPSVSRLTMVTAGEDVVIDQIIKQTRKLVDVIEIADRRWRFTREAAEENAPVRDATTTNQWRARALPTGTLDAIEGPRRSSAKRAMALIVGAVVLLAVIVGYLLAARA